MSSSSFLNGDIGIIVVWSWTSENKSSSRLFGLPFLLFSRSYLLPLRSTVVCLFVCRYYMYLLWNISWSNTSFGLS
jgi:hypothetical protein